MCWVIFWKICEDCTQTQYCYNHNPNNICRVCGKVSSWAIKCCYEHDPNNICRVCGTLSSWAIKYCASCDPQTTCDYCGTKSSFRVKCCAECYYDERFPERKNHWQFPTHVRSSTLTLFYL